MRLRRTGQASRRFNSQERVAGSIPISPSVQAGLRNLRRNAEGLSEGLTLLRLDQLRKKIDKGHNNATPNPVPHSYSYHIARESTIFVIYINCIDVNRLLKRDLLLNIYVIRQQSGLHLTPSTGRELRTPLVGR